MTIFNMVKAFAPANISLIFKVCEDSNPRWKGSLGLGFTVDEGVTVTAGKAQKTAIFFNGKKINLPTVENVVNKLICHPEFISGSQSKNLSADKAGMPKQVRHDTFKVRHDNKFGVLIKIASSLPLGCGFGISGAAALATAYAINKLFNLKKSDRQLAILAHTAEVEEQTGLGDVVNQFYGGFLLKTKPSSQFTVKQLPISDIPIYYKVFGKIKTKSIISNPKQLEKINLVAEKYLKEIPVILNVVKYLNKKDPSSRQRRTQGDKIGSHFMLSKILDISKKFAIDSGLLQRKELINLINKIEHGNGHASMIMLGNSLLSDTPFEGCSKLIISNNKARLLSS